MSFYNSNRFRFPLGIRRLLRRRIDFGSRVVEYLVTLLGPQIHDEIAQGLVELEPRLLHVLRYVMVGQSLLEDLVPPVELAGENRQIFVRATNIGAFVGTTSITEMSSHKRDLTLDEGGFVGPGKKKANDGIVENTIVEILHHRAQCIFATYLIR